MIDNREVYEAHCCVVCGRPHTMLVIYNPDGRFIDATVTTPGGHRVPDPAEPLAACDFHPADEVKAALGRRKARAERLTRGEEEED
jgi:hypothetical protein